MRNPFLAVLICLSAPAAVSAQKRAALKAGKFCESYLLKKVAAESAAGGRAVRLKRFNPRGETLPPGVERWLRDMREEDLAAFELRGGGRKALALVASHAGATGLATSLWCWRVETADNVSADFVSFSENPGLIFWDKGGRLNYYAVVYGDDFIPRKDWDNLTFNLERHRVAPDGSDQQLGQEVNVKCEAGR